MLLSDSSPFWHWQAAYRPAAYWLALSGGRDSMALLQALVAQRQRLTAPLVACYVDHGWSAASSEWGAFCVREAAARGVGCEVLRLNWQAAPGESLEARARLLRYQALAARLPPRGVLLTARIRSRRFFCSCCVAAGWTVSQRCPRSVRLPMARTGALCWIRRAPR